MLNTRESVDQALLFERPCVLELKQLVSDDEKAFIIDVQKAGDKSHFFLTVESLFGRLTLDAGVIKRSVKKPGEPEEPEPLYYKIITRLQEAYDQR